ncbi:MAG TPA: biotin/lipoyl-containing protein [Ktedonobacterales bacterium]|nr:biotin/lipoyl-containing protein [Ktedonobacterales bacterium]
MDRIKALAEAMSGTDVSELDLAEGGTHIVIRRRLNPPAMAPHAGSNGVARAVRGSHVVPLSESPAAPADSSVAIVAPLTGVFYPAASPTSPPFVQVGDAVQAGQTVCIVEAMKVFNEITSEVAGTVKSVQAQFGQLVHAGEALIRVQPA